MNLPYKHIWTVALLSIALHAQTTAIQSKAPEAPEFTSQEALKAFQPLLEVLKNKSACEQVITGEQLIQTLQSCTQQIQDLDLAKLSAAAEKAGIVTKTGNAALLAAFGIIAACVYGITHDMITASICPEYFNSEAHPNHYRMMQNFGYETPEDITDVPTIALNFGIKATWWVGLPIGLGLAAASQLGTDLPALELKDFLDTTLLKAFGVLGGSALISGIAGYVLAKNGYFNAVGAEHLLGREKHDKFLGVGFAHTVAYMVAPLVGLYLMHWAVKKRAFIGQEQMRSQLVEALQSLIKSAQDLTQNQSA